MTQTVNFRKVEVIGTDKAEALAKAPFTTYMKEATQKFKKWKESHKNGYTESDIKQFMLDYLEENTRFAPGVACYITLDSAVKDTRERPYVIEDVKNELGARNFGTVFQLVDDATGAPIAETNVEFVPKVDKETGKPEVDEDGNPVMVMKCATKAEAKDLGRELYTDGDFRGNLTCYITKQVIKGQNVAFRMKYAPSKSARCGRYLCFGVAAD